MGIPAVVLGHLAKPISSPEVPIIAMTVTMLRNM